MLLNFWATIIKKLFSLSFHLFFSIRLKNLIRRVGQLQLIAGVKWVTGLNCIGFAVDVCNFTLLNQIINGSTFLPSFQICEATFMLGISNVQTQSNFVTRSPSVRILFVKWSPTRNRTENAASKLQYHACKNVCVPHAENKRLLQFVQY